MDSLHHEQNNFKPFIPAEKRVSEFTATSVILGIILAVLFGGANAYLGLRVGMTVSASIPAAVISMGVIRIILRKDSVLENNMVQTIGSAGESLAAGAIFTHAGTFYVGSGRKKYHARIRRNRTDLYLWRGAWSIFHDPAALRTHCTGAWAYCHIRKEQPVQRYC